MRLLSDLGWLFNICERLLTMRRLWRDWTYLYSYTRLYPNGGAAHQANNLLQSASPAACERESKRAREWERGRNPCSGATHDLPCALGFRFFGKTNRKRYYVIYRAIIIGKSKSQSRNRGSRPSSDASCGNNSNTKLVRTKIDDVVVNAPALQPKWQWANIRIRERNNVGAQLCRRRMKAKTELICVIKSSVLLCSLNGSGKLIF